MMKHLPLFALLNAVTIAASAVCTPTRLESGNLNQILDSDDEGVAKIRCEIVKQEFEMTPA
jgi:hypothetical protein